MDLNISNKLQAAVRSGRVPNAWLFVGADKDEMRRVAMEVVQAMVCDQSPQACGQCGPCRRVLAGTSESLIWLAPEKNMIKIESAREVLQQLSLAHWGKRRVVVVEQAHLLNPQAANALLKVIEEPPPQTHFILLTGSQESVLKTIRSRSQLIYFPSLGRRTQEAAPESQVAAQTWQQLLQSPAPEVVEFLRDHVDGREGALQVVRGWHEYVRDSWYVQAGIRQGLLNPELAMGVSQSVAWSPEQLSRYSEKILAAERDLLANCEAQLTLENLVYQLHGYEGAL